MPTDPPHTYTRTPRKPADWLVVYYVIAVVGLLAIGGSLLLGREAIGTFRHSVAVHQEWSLHLLTLEGIAGAAADVIAPNRTLRKTQSTSGEALHRADALARFRTLLGEFRALAGEIEDRRTRETLSKHASRIGAAMDEVQRHPAADLSFNVLSHAILDANKAVREVQRRHLHNRFDDATTYSVLQYLLGAAVAIVLCGAMVYGRRLSLAFNRFEREREQHVSELEAMSQRLEAAAAAADSASKAKSDFLAMMSHEIRTPMNGVLGMAGVLLDGELSAEQRRGATTIRESAETLLRILNDILDFSKLEAGAMQIEKTPFDLRELLRYAVEIVAPRTKARPVTLELSVAENVPRYLRSDPGRIRQVMLNFLGNAVKFTERGSIVLYVSATPRGTLRVEVRDTGIGIAPDRLSLLFKSFQQTDASVARKFGGTGLGLAISKRLIELLGGAVGVESATGVGSNFWFEIPLELATADDLAKDVRGGDAAVDDAQLRIKGLGRPVRLLIVEDNATNLLVARSVLGKFGIVPDVAGNGVEAVEAVRRLPYDVVLMDVHMPQMDGLEATQAIRSLPGDAAKVPIIALTANAFADDVARCIAAGMNGHLSKPFHRDALVVAIGAALAQRSAYSSPLLQGGGSGDVIDWAVLESFEKTGGEEMLRLLIDTFLSSTATMLERLASVAGNANDIKEAMRVVHSIKSSSAQAGAPALSRVAAALEAQTAGGQMIGDADVGEVNRLFGAYKAALEAKGMIAA